MKRRTPGNVRLKRSYKIIRHCPRIAGLKRSCEIYRILSPHPISLYGFRVDGLSPLTTGGCTLFTI